MIEKSKVIFGNKISDKDYNSALKSKKSYIKKYGDDSQADYKISFKDIPTLDFINASNIVFGDKSAVSVFNSVIC